MKQHPTGDIQVTVIQSISSWARRLKHEIIALYLAYRHPDTPLFAKVIAFAVVAYAFSPIDLIPDFIPILGYLSVAIWHHASNQTHSRCHYGTITPQSARQ